MAKKTLTLFDGPAPGGITSIPDIDLSAWEAGVLYAEIRNKTTSFDFAFTFYAHEKVTGLFTVVASGSRTTDGTTRIVVADLREETYQLDFNVPGTGADVTVTLVVEDE